MMQWEMQHKPMGAPGGANMQPTIMTVCGAASCSIRSSN